MAGIDSNTKLLLHGTSFIDSSNYNTTVTNNGLSVPFSNHKFSDCPAEFYFDGSYISMATSSLFSGNSAFTLEAWVYPTVRKSADIVFSWGGSNHSNGTGGVVAINNDGTLAYYAAGTQIQGGTVPLNEWSHVALAGNGSAIKLYLNGELIGTDTITYNLDGSTTFKIGMNGDSNSENYTGYITEVRLSNIERWSTNFSVQTEEYVSDSNTKLLLHGCDSTDSSSNAIALTFNNITFPFTGHKFSAYPSEYIFSGGYIGVSLASLFSGNSAFTVDAWIFPTTYKSAGTLFSFGGSNAGSGSGGVVSYNNGNINYYASGFRIASGGTVPLNAWSHVAFIGNGTSLKLYLNGELIGTDTINYNFSASITLRIGQNESAPYNEYFSGYMAEIRVSDTERWSTTFTPPTEPYSIGGVAESGHTDLQRNLSAGQLNHADMRLNAVLQYFGNADSLRKINKNEHNPADMYREVKKAQFSDVDMKRAIYNTEIGNTDTKKAIYNTEIGNTDTKRSVLYEAIAESGYSDITRKILKAQKVNADMHRGIAGIYSGHADILSSKVILATNFSDIRRIILASESLASDMFRTIYARENGNADIRRIITQGTSAESGCADLLLQTLIAYAGHTDILRHIIWGENGRSDLRRIIPYSVDIDGNSLEYQGYGIHLREKIFSDAFDIITPRSDISTDNQISGKVGDFNFSFLVESTRRLGAGLTSISGRYNQDYIFFTAYYVNSVGNALMSAGPFGYNRILDLPVKSYFHSFRYGPTITGMLTFADIMNQLYGWTTRIPTQQINVFIRSDALYIVQRGYEPNTIDLSNTAHTLPEVSTELMRLTWNYDSENNNGGVQTIDQTPDPFTGSITFGDSVNSYVGGLLMTETRDNESTEYSYTSYDGKNMYPSQKVITNSKDNTVTTTKYSYLPTNDAADIYLYEEEETQVKTLSGGGTTTTVRKTIHTPIAGGWYGHKLYVDDKLQSTTMTQGKPGQKVSLYSINEANKSLDSIQSKTKNATRPNWYLIRANGFPFAKSDTSDINRINQAYALLNRSTKEEIAFDVYGLTHIVDFTDLILYEGNEYHLVSNDILKTPTELKQHIVFNRYVKNGVTL